MVSALTGMNIALMRMSPLASSMICGEVLYSRGVHGAASSISEPMTRLDKKPTVSSCGQEVLERSALTIDPKDGVLTVRFSAGFPAAGRTTLAMELRKMLIETFVNDVAEKNAVVCCE